MAVQFEEDFDSDQHDFLSSILQASHFAHVMIDDVIAMYQLKDQEYIVAPEVITLRPWLKDVVAGCRSGAKCAVKLVIPKESDGVRALPPAVLISKGPLQLVRQGVSHQPIELWRYERGVCIYYIPPYPPHSTPHVP